VKFPQEYEEEQDDPCAKAEEKKNGTAESFELGYGIVIEKVGHDAEKR